MTHLINFITVRLVSAFRVFHFLDHVLVKAEAKSVLVIDQRLENKVQTLFDDLEVFDVSAVVDNVAVRQHCDGKGQDVVR